MQLFGEADLIAFVALASGVLVMVEPRLFWPVLMADLWLLGYPHVIATWTRIAMDGEGFARHRFLALGLPVPVLLGTLALAAFVGFWAVATIYLYWQWFHYTRQSWGIIRAYGRKAGSGGRLGPKAPLPAAMTIARQSILVPAEVSSRQPWFRRAIFSTCWPRW